MNTYKNDTTTPAIKHVFDEIKNFEAVQRKYKTFGAYDTEPDGIFQQLIARAAKGRKPNIPRTGDAWELYANSMNCDEAAQALHDQALKVVIAVENCAVRDFDLLQAKVRDYCWRVY